ncbi:hypothetical protein [Pseudoalteromonas phenolica]|uniref:hypothetical protein n=1 Tax=Pseudoalteromonas phenolica TaxID=161398 RepID=UPI00110A517C|nr:hypothetical protein [Pseudoalteromonas phenolica]TMO54346.1 hypothetical protein CWC21_15520 [Pseudoalteromonas phenolica]
MHPFSLNKAQQKTINGGLLPLKDLKKETQPAGCVEGGGIIPPDIFKDPRKETQPSGCVEGGGIIPPDFFEVKA